MQPLNVVIAQQDCARSKELAIALQPHFRKVSIVIDVEELHRCTLRNRAALAVVDLELLSVSEVATYCEKFPNVAVVCTYRVPDNKMLMQVLNVGAMSYCHTLDVRVIVDVAQSKSRLAKATAA